MILGQVRWIRYFHTVPKQTERTGLIPFALFPDTAWIKKSNPKVPCHGIRTTLSTLVSLLNIQRITHNVNMDKKNNKIFKFAIEIKNKFIYKTFLVLFL